MASKMASITAPKNVNKGAFLAKNNKKGCFFFSRERFLAGDVFRDPFRGSLKKRGALELPKRCQ